MQRQRIAIKLTSVSTLVGDFTASLEGWGGEVEGVTAIRGQVRSLVRALVRKFNTHLNRSLTATITLEDGTKLEVAVDVDLTGVYTPQITEQSLKVAMGKEIPIKFGSTIHDTLYQIHNGRRLGARKSAVALRSLELISSWGDAITERGKQVLEQLEELGPPENKRGRTLVAKVLLNSTSTRRGVVLAYLEGHKFIYYQFRSTTYELTDKGKQWLEDRAHIIYNYKLPPSFNKADLIPFMSKEQLVAPLTSLDPPVRKAARTRMEKLGGEVVEEEEQEPIVMDDMIKRLWRERFGKGD